MKKLLAVALMFIAPVVFAGQRFVPQNNPCIFKSSFTITADTSKYISNSKYLASVIVSSASAGGWLKIYDSTWTTTSQVLPAIDLSTLGEWELNIAVINGITYSASGNTNGVAIIYREKE